MRWEEYASGSRIDHFAWWCETYLVQSIDQFAGEPLVIEPWQVEFMGEALATSDPTGATPSWGSVTLVVSRKNGKTSMLAAYALYRLLMDETQPEILLAAASDKQAGRLFDSIVSYIRRNPELASMVVLREYIGEIARADGGGKIMRMASDPNTLHGFSPSLVIADELHAWTKPTQRKAWAALTTGGGARKNTQTFTITTAGDANERDTGILGRMIDRNESVGDVEKHPGLTISRNKSARTLIYNYWRRRRTLPIVPVSNSRILRRGLRRSISSGRLRILNYLLRRSFSCMGVCGLRVLMRGSRRIGGITRSSGT
jgi:hypothetical protein